MTFDELKVIVLVIVEKMERDAGFWSLALPITHAGSMLSEARGAQGKEGLVLPQALEISTLGTWGEVYF